MRVMTKTVVGLLMFVGWPVYVCQTASADVLAWTPDQLKEFHQRVDTLRTDRGVPSAQIALIRRDETVVLNFGTAKPGEDVPVTDQTMFRAGSVSKSVAGVAMMMLVERGLVSLDDRLRDLAPELGIRNPWYPDHPVRLVHLLEASAGFVGFFPEDYGDSPDPLEIPVAEVVEPWPRLDVQWKPGYYTSYHDRGPTITAYLVEKITSQDFGEFVREEIFGPLGMKQSGYFRTEAIAGHLAKPATSHEAGSAAYAHYKLWPSSSLNSSAGEFSAFVKMLLERGTFKGNLLLRPESVERIETPASTLAARKAGAALGHGINSFTTNYRGLIYHGHPGNTDNYTAAYGYRPESGTGFVFMSTVSASGDWMLWQGINAILNFLHPDAHPPEAAPLEPADRAVAAGCFERLNPWMRSKPLDHVRIREKGEKLVIVHEETGRTASLERMQGQAGFRILNWRPDRDELTDLVLVPDDSERIVLQMLNYPFEAYGKIPCDQQ